MIEIDMAIEHYRYGINHDIFAEPVTTYARLAIAALQEKQERERGCRHCLKSRFIHYSYSAENFVEEVFIKNGCQMTITNCAVLGGTFRAGEDVYFKINFCPICGRKLGENNG